MKNKILNIMKYFLKNYPHKSELSASRLTKMVYLSDWKSAIENEKQLTDALWHFHHYGPYIDDFLKLAFDDKDIEVEETINMFGNKKQLIKLKESFQEEINLPDETKKILDFVISSTKQKNYEDFIKLVYSTYPVISSNRYSDFNLVEMAKNYKEILTIMSPEKQTT